MAIPVGMLAVLGALSTFGPLSTDMYLPGLPAMARSLHTTESSAQLTLSTCLIGLAVGQLFAGPLSDALGRRRPLLIGLAAFALASALCGFSPSLGLLLVLRFVQGLAGAAGLAIARAIVRDRTQGLAAARAYALLMIVTSLGPIFAPVAGGLLLHITNWRGIFVALAIIGVAMLAGTAALVPETLLAQSRHRGGLITTRAAFGVLVRDRRYLASVFAGSFSTAALLAWIAGSPFVLEHIHHLSPQLFSLVFAANGAGILIARQIASRFIARAGPAGVMRAGQACQTAGALGALCFTLLDPVLLPLLICIFVAVASVGAIMPMATALAMNDHPKRAGSASGLLGFMLFTLGSAIAPLVGIAGVGSALPMTLTMAVCASGSAVAGLALRALSGTSAGSAPARR
jgi:DHA1 family bicyclomycin/chloramphenicol resistance-like MFS transporter